jgi:hypothetical protein
MADSSLQYTATPLEEAYTSYLLETVFDVSTKDPPVEIKISGREAVTFLSKSAVHRLILRNLWSAVDPHSSGSLRDRGQLSTLLRCVALAQHPRQDSLLDQALRNAYHEQQSPVAAIRACLLQTAAQTDLPLAQFEGIPLPDRTMLRPYLADSDEADEEDEEDEDFGDFAAASQPPQPTSLGGGMPAYHNPTTAQTSTAMPSQAAPAANGWGAFDTLATNVSSKAPPLSHPTSAGVATSMIPSTASFGSNMSSLPPPQGHPSFQRPQQPQPQTYSAPLNGSMGFGQPQLMPQTLDALASTSQPPLAPLPSDLGQLAATVAPSEMTHPPQTHATLPSQMTAPANADDDFGDFASSTTPAVEEPSGWDALDALAASTPAPPPPVLPDPTASIAPSGIASAISVQEDVMEDGGFGDFASSTTHQQPAPHEQPSGWDALDALASTVPTPVLGSASITNIPSIQPTTLTPQVELVGGKDDFGDFASSTETESAQQPSGWGALNALADSTPTPVQPHMPDTSTMPTGTAVSTEPSGWDALDALAPAASSGATIDDDFGGFTSSSIKSTPTDDIVASTTSVSSAPAVGPGWDANNALMDTAPTLAPDSSLPKGPTGWDALNALADSAPVLPSSIPLQLDEGVTVATGGEGTSAAVTGFGSPDALRDSSPAVQPPVTPTDYEFGDFASTSSLAHSGVSAFQSGQLANTSPDSGWDALDALAANIPVPAPVVDDDFGDFASSDPTQTTAVPAIPVQSIEQTLNRSTASEAANLGVNGSSGWNALDALSAESIPPVSAVSGSLSTSDQPARIDPDLAMPIVAGWGALDALASQAPPTDIGDADDFGDFASSGPSQQNLVSAQAPTPPDPSLLVEQDDDFGDFAGSAQVSPGNPPAGLRLISEPTSVTSDWGALDALADSVSATSALEAVNLTKTLSGNSGISQSFQNDSLYANGPMAGNSGHDAIGGGALDPSEDMNSAQSTNARKCVQGTGSGLGMNGFHAEKPQSDVTENCLNGTNLPTDGFGFDGDNDFGEFEAAVDDSSDGENKTSTVSLPLQDSPTGENTPFETPDSFQSPPEVRGDAPEVPPKSAMYTARSDSAYYSARASSIGTTSEISFSDNFVDAVQSSTDLPAESSADDPFTAFASLAPEQTQILSLSSFGSMASDDKKFDVTEEDAPLSMPQLDGLSASPGLEFIPPSAESLVEAVPVIEPQPATNVDDDDFGDFEGVTAEITDLNTAALNDTPGAVAKSGDTATETDDCGDFAEASAGESPNFPGNTGEEIDLFGDFAATQSSTPAPNLPSSADLFDTFATPSAAENHTNDEEDFGDFGDFTGPSTNSSQPANASFPTENTGSAEGLKDAVSDGSVDSFRDFDAVPTHNAMSDDSGDDWDAFKEASSIPKRRKNDPETINLLKIRDFVLAASVHVPESLLQCAGSSGAHVDFAVCFEANIGLDVPVSQERKSRMQRCLQILTLLSSERSKLASAYWSATVIAARDDLSLGLSLCSEAKALANKERTTALPKLEQYFHGLGEVVRVVRTIVATIGDMLMLDASSLFTVDTLASSWCSLAILKDALEIEALWKELSEGARMLGLKVDDTNSNRLPSIAELRSVSSVNASSADSLCYFTLQPITQGETATTSKVEWGGHAFMACSANFLSNRCTFFSIKD